MKIFATSDIHGNRMIFGKLRSIKNCDLLLVCGDIGGKDMRFGSFDKFSDAQQSDARLLSATIKGLPFQGRFILGNDDWFDYSGDFKMTRSEIIGNWKFEPFEHVLSTHFNTNREMNDNMLMYQLRKLEGGKDSIVVAHTPPYGCGDKITTGARVGSKSVRDWIEAKKPKIWLNGHIHEDNGVRQIGSTVVFNCACDYRDSVLRGWLIDLESGDFESVAI
jgi:Icc-related predicted phosphoesterase